MNPTEYSIRYSSSTIGAGGNIVLPGGTSELRADGTGIHHTTSAAAGGTDDDDDDEGVVIVPDPTGIVIKTRLLQRDAHHILLVPCTDDTANEHRADTKVFLNICTHPVIARPGPRSPLDECDRDNDDIEGWRLPLSMSDLRPCRDKTGRTALAADCILNPAVVEEMHADAHRRHFVCDLVVQCAAKKFGATWSKLGLEVELDRRIKLPKMRYAGYVDERTGMPVMPEGVAGTDPRPVVAKQRVKRNGGKAPIVEEVAARNDRTTADDSGEKPLIQEVATVALSPRKEENHPIKMELFIKTDGMGSVTLEEFLKSMAAKHSFEFSSPRQPTKLLREFLSSPKLKANIHGRLHDSQLLTTPIPFAITKSMTNDPHLRNGCIIAKCDTKVSNSVPTQDSLPNVNASALLLEVSLGSNKTECVLPFPVDTPRVSCQFSQANGTLEVTMPLLPTSVDVPDHGTRQWDLRQAFGDGNVQESNSDDDAESDARLETADIDILDAYFVEGDDRNDESNDDRPLPEDAFHSRDALSSHLLQQQKKEMEERQAKSKESREDTDVEYIDVNDFQPGGKYFNSIEEVEVTEEVDESKLTLKKAEDVMKQKLSGIGCGLAFSLV